MSSTRNFKSKDSHEFGIMLQSVKKSRRRHICKRIPYCRGFTLLEIMVAVSLTAIVLVALFKMHHQTLSMNMSAVFDTQAPLLARQKIAELLTMKPADLLEDSGDFGDQYPGYNWHISMDTVESESLGEVGLRLKKIDMTIDYNQGALSYSTRCYRLFSE